MVGIAMLGAGIFALTEHLPAIEACSLYRLKAVYSRSQKSAEAFKAQSKAGAGVDTYFDSPEAEGKSLDHVLARDDVEAVIVCLPIPAQAAVIKKALAAGKHVFSEKPVAGDVASASALLGWHAALASPPVWAVAENFRFMKGLRLAADKARDLGGELVGFYLTMGTLIQPDNKFWNTDWRKTPEYQGGFLLDGGVHFIAGLRLLLSVFGHEVKQVACFSALLQPRLLPVDTVRAVLRTDRGTSGLLSISFATEFKPGLEIELVSTRGRLTVTPAKITTAVRSSSGSGPPDEASQDVERDNGLAAEFAAFAESLAGGTVDPRQSPQEALDDLALLEALLRSGEADAALTTVATY